MLLSTPYTLSCALLYRVMENFNEQVQLGSPLLWLQDSHCPELCPRSQCWHSLISQRLIPQYHRVFLSTPDSLLLVIIV